MGNCCNAEQEHDLKFEPRKSMRIEVQKYGATAPEKDFLSQSDAIERIK